MMKIKVEPLLMKKGQKVAKAAIEFTDDILKGFHLVGFTICDDPVKGLFVLFPANIVKEVGKDNKTFFFLRPSDANQLDNLEDAIIDAYEAMVGAHQEK